MADPGRRAAHRRHRRTCAVAGRPSHRLRPLVCGRAVLRRHHRLPRTARRRGPVLGAAACAVCGLRCLATHFPGRAGRTRDGGCRRAAGLLDEPIGRPTGGQRAATRLPASAAAQRRRRIGDIPYRFGHPSQARRPVPRVGRHRVHGAASRRRCGAAQGGKRRRHPIGHAGRRAHRGRTGPADRLFRQYSGAAQRLTWQSHAA